MTDLTTISSVEQWLQLQSGNVDEALLTLLITAVSDAVERYCSRCFALQSYTETRDGTGGVRLSTREKPVTAVASVTIDGVAVPASAGAPQSGYLFSETAITLIGWRFRRGLSNVALAYTAGYATIPTSLAQAANEWVAYVYREKSRIGMVSETAGPGQTTSYLVRDMPPRVATLLAPFKRVVPV
jgi:hypothetical protein